MGLSTSPGMAVAVLPPRSSQSLRQRRESVRPGLSRISTRASTVEALETPLPSEPPPLGELARLLVDQANARSRDSRLYPEEVQRDAPVAGSTSSPKLLSARSARGPHHLRLSPLRSLETCPAAYRSTRVDRGTKQYQRSVVRRYVASHHNVALSDVYRLSYCSDSELPR
jgi:hypothetical protein